tara:strand:+ start:20328 stop:21041 length:714 start_codon:yes stop_codon:yes gene_type:complete
MYKDKVQGVFIHHSFFEIEDLSLPQKLIYAKVCDLDNEKGCYASNMYFAKLFKISTRQVSTHINNLVSKGYVTSKFVYKPNSKEIDYRVLNTTSRGIEELKHKGYGRTIPISKDNTNNNIKEREEKFIQEVESFEKYKDIADAFIRHYTEPNRSNTKMLWELQKTWSTSRRLATWLERDAEWGNKSKTTTEFKLDATGKFYIAYCKSCQTSDFYDRFEIKQDSRCCQSALTPERKAG